MAVAQKSARIGGLPLLKTTGNYIIARRTRPRPLGTLHGPFLTLRTNHVHAARPQERGPQGDAAAAQDHQPVRAEQGQALDCRGRLQAVAGRRSGRGIGDGVSRADAIRAGGIAGAASLRIRQGGVRAQPGGPPRSSGVLAMRSRRGILRRRDREAPDQDRPRARVRDQRARALPLRRVHAGEVSASQAGRPRLRRGNHADAVFLSGAWVTLLVSYFLSTAASSRFTNSSVALVSIQRITATTSCSGST